MSSLDYTSVSLPADGSLDLTGLFDLFEFIRPAYDLLRDALADREPADLSPSLALEILLDQQDYMVSFSYLSYRAKFLLVVPRWPLPPSWTYSTPSFNLMLSGPSANIIGTYCNKCPCQTGIIWPTFLGSWTTAW